MKKKLMAMLVAAAMLVCMMPAMAFADEPPAEEQVVQATEEVVVPEAAEEEAVAPETVEEGAALEDEAVVEEAAVEEAVVEEAVVEECPDGSWKGWVFTYTGSEEEVAKIKVWVNGSIIDYTIKVGENDFSAVADEYAAQGMVILGLFGDGWNDFTIAYPLKTKVVVDKAASKDTVFTYQIENVVVYTEKEGGGLFFEIKPATDFEVGEDFDTDLFGNTITLKAGQTTAEGYLYFGAQTKVQDAKYSTCAFLITEKGNDGGYTTDTSVWAWYPSGTGVGAKGNFARFDSLNDVQALLDKVNASDYKTGEELLLAAFQYEEMTFTHTVEAKGVQTGDSNSLGLWVVVMAVAGVAAAAVALKRREN